jgi:hypothetical protein
MDITTFPRVHWVLTALLTGLLVLLVIFDTVEVQPGRIE